MGEPRMTNHKEAGQEGSKKEKVWSVAEKFESKEKMVDFLERFYARFDYFDGMKASFDDHENTKETIEVFRSGDRLKMEELMDKKFKANAPRIYLPGLDQCILMTKPRPEFSEKGSLVFKGVPMDGADSINASVIRALGELGVSVENMESSGKYYNKSDDIRYAICMRYLSSESVKKLQELDVKNGSGKNEIMAENSEAYDINDKIRILKLLRTLEDNGTKVEKTKIEEQLLKDLEGIELEYFK